MFLEILQKTLAQELFCGLCGISKNNLFTEHSRRLLLKRQKIYKPNICSCKKIKIQNFSKKTLHFSSIFSIPKKNQDQYKEVRNERPNIVIKNSIQVAVYGIANSSYYKISKEMPVNENTLCLFTLHFMSFMSYWRFIVCPLDSRLNIRVNR